MSEQPNFNPAWEVSMGLMTAQVALETGASVEDAHLAVYGVLCTRGRDRVTARGVAQIVLESIESVREQQ